MSERLPLPSDVLEARREALERASVWREQAGVLLRRALRPETAPADVDEAKRRAAWYQARAEVLTSTLPQAYLPRPIYPRELATPRDVLDVVDELRHTLAELQAFALYLRAEDLEAFGRALEGGPPREVPPEALERLEHLAGELAEALGAAGEPFTPYELPLVDAGAGDAGDH